MLSQVQMLETYFCTVVTKKSKESEQKGLQWERNQVEEKVIYNTQVYRAACASQTSNLHFIETPAYTGDTNNKK